MDIYQYVRPLGKIDDDVALRDEFIALYDAKSHKEMAQFCLALGAHLLDLTGFEAIDEIVGSFEGINEWLEDMTNYHKARNFGFEIGRIATKEDDPIKARFYRTMAQVAGSPHVKYHALWATDFAVTLINRLHPGDDEAVRKERQTHIDLLKAIARDDAHS